jgi:signal transduction histidine kinase
MPEAAAPRRAPAGRRRLRTRIIVTFTLLGFCLTALFAYATIELRTRVENQLLSESLNRNIDAYASAFQRDPGNATFSFEGVRGWVYSLDKLGNAPEDWRELKDGIHELHGTEDGQAFAYKLAVRRTPTHAFFLAYDMTQTLQGQGQQNRMLVATVVVFTALALVLGWWSASRVMAPVSDLAQRLRRSGTSSDPAALAPHFAEDEVGELAKALDDYAGRLTEVVQRDREFNADVSHELRTPLAVIRGAVELLLSKPEVDETHARACSASSAPSSNART